MEGDYQTGQIYEIPVQDGFVVGPPVWEDHYPTGRNWLARISESPRSPGGFAREWCDRGQGRFRYSVKSLVVGSTIEFGADRLYASTDGRRRVRWYGEVIKVSSQVLWVRYFETATDMFDTIKDRESRLQEAR